MYAKRIAIALALACLVGMAGAAQAGKAADTPLISIENGYSIGYNLNANDYGTAMDLSILLGVADKLQFGFTVLTGNDTIFGTYKLFSLNYSIVPKVGVTTILGTRSAGASGTGTVAGLGLYTTVLERSVGDLSTAFKLRLDYIPLLSDFTNAVLRVDLLASIGI